MISVPAFREAFGHMYEGKYYVGARWVMAFNTVGSVGGLVGCLVAGNVMELLGRRLTLALACVNTIGAVFLQVFARHHVLLLVGKVWLICSSYQWSGLTLVQLINGFSLGAYLTIASAFASECCPKEIRGISTSGMQLSIGLFVFKHPLTVGHVHD